MTGVACCCCLLLSGSAVWLVFVVCCCLLLFVVSVCYACWCCLDVVGWRCVLFALGLLYVVCSVLFGLVVLNCLLLRVVCCCWHL